MLVLRVIVRYFGALYEHLGVFQDLIIIRGNRASINDVLKEVEKLRPELKMLKDRIPLLWIFRNGRQVLGNEEVRDGDVIWIMPTMHEGG